MKVCRELADPRQSGVGVTGQIDVAYTLLRDPSGADLPVRVSSVEEPTEAFFAVLRQPFTGDHQQLSGPVESVGLAAPVAELFVLDTPTNQIQFRVGEVRSGRSALPAFRLAGFSGPSPEPDVRLSSLCRTRHSGGYVE